MQESGVTEMAGRSLLPVAIVAAALVSVTGALAAARMSAPLPAMSSLVLSAADFRSGAGVAAQATRTVSGIPAFERVLKPGTIGTTHLLNTVAIALLEPDAASAIADFTQLNGEAQSPAGRQAIAKAWATEFVKGANLGSHGKAKLVIKQTTAGPPIEAATNALRLPITMKTNRGTLHISLQVAQTDRAVVIVELLSVLNGRISSADAAHTLTATQQHLQTAFTVANTTAPTINGTQTQGQLVTVDEGSWTGAPSAFTYSWSRCDTNGANCAPLANATANTYQLTPADAGTTLRVTVTATNSISSQQQVSNPTATIT